MATAATAGIGFKPQHADDVLASASPGLWLEVHPENYMVDGGPRLALLDTLAERFPLSLHGVSLSLASPGPPDAAHLARLRAMARRVRPFRVSEHLAWSRQGSRHFPDLLPFPRSQEALACVVDNIARTQDALGQVIAIENPSHYVPLDGHAWSEADFLREMSRRTGCQLLLDINNVYVSARNLGYDAMAYLAAFPLDRVSEIHLAGHAADDTLGDALLVDSHDTAVTDAVWALYRAVLAKTGPVPTLIERDGNVPAFAELMAERDMAHGPLHAHAEAA